MTRLDPIPIHDHADPWRRLPQWILRTDVATFNRRCAVAALLWLAVTVPLGLYFRPTFQDFPQFYMEGVIARAGAWDALYPIPRADITTNPGLAEDSIAKPRYTALRRAHCCPDITRPILPPQSALLFIPLSWMSYYQAFGVWAAILSLCVWVVSLQAGRVYRILSGGPTHWEGVLCVLTVIAPMTARSIRITNTTPAVALCIGLTVLGAIRHDRFRTGLAVVLGATLKYVTLVLLPILLLARRWRTLAGAAVCGLIFGVVAVAVEGVGPFREFVTVIAPTLDRPHLFPGNQSLTGFIGRIEPSAEKFGIPRFAMLPLHVGRLAMLGALLLLLFRRRREDWRRPVYVCAGAAALICWMLIFSPITWEHYPIFLGPLGGWVLWEGMRARWRFVLVAVTAVLLSMPVSIIHVHGFFAHRLVLPEPWNSSQLVGIAIVFVLALRRLAAPRGPRVASVWRQPARRLVLPPRT